MAGPTARPLQLTVRGRGARLRQTCPDTGLWLLAADGASLRLEGTALVGGPPARTTILGMAIGTRTVPDAFAGHRARIELDGVDVSGFDPGAAGTVIEVGASDPAARGPALDVVDSRLHGNRRTVVGGTGGSVHVRDSAIVDNDGSGIALTDGHPLVVERSRVAGNRDTGIGTTANGFVPSNLEVRDSTVTGNGRVGVSCSQCGRVRIERTTIAGNGQLAPDSRGGLAVAFLDRASPSGAGASLDIRDTRIVENVSNATAGPSFAGGVTATLTSPGFVTPDTQPSVEIRGGEISGNRTSGGGGALLIDRGKLRVEGTRFAANRSIVGGGAIRAADPYGRPTGVPALASVTLAGATFDANESSGAGGAVDVDADTMTVERTTFADNVSGGVGGAVHAAARRTVVREAHVRGNRASGSGGGLHVGGLLSLGRATFEGNESGAAGGALSLEAYADAAIDNTTFAANRAAAGGAVAFGDGVGARFRHVTSAGNVARRGNDLWAASNYAIVSILASAFSDAGGASCELPPGTPLDTRLSRFTDASCGAAAADVVTERDMALGRLSANGGYAPTRVPRPTSVLIDRVPLDDCPLARDQRGKLRPTGLHCDVGAVETFSNASPFVLVPVDPWVRELRVAEPVPLAVPATWPRRD